MRAILQVPNPQLIGAALLLLLLACGPLNRLQEINQKSRALATGVAIMDQGDYTALDAYKNLDQLPGYRLESRNTIRDSAGNLTTLLIVSHHDAGGNIHTLTQTPDGQQHETYFVNGHIYVFEAQYSGWVDLGAVSATEAQHPNNSYLVEWQQFKNPVQLLSQLGAIPTETGRETIQGRAATRYELEYIAAELTQAFGNQPGAITTDLSGTLWVDNQTGALLKSKILFYENKARQPTQEFVLETGQIGNIAPIELPAPVVDPEAIVSATATAQAWSVLQVQLDYQDTPITFELVPIQVSQVASNTVHSADMQLLLRQLPPDLLPATEAQPFLTQLGRQLTLSIPRHNLVVASNGFQIKNIDSPNRSMEVIYHFEADLANSRHVELILSSPGNPLLAPVPVADK